jgi:hypothetical protein
VTDLVVLLQEFYRDKLTDLLRHEAGARMVGQYDINNTYQYIINREDVQLSWVAKALLDLDAALPADQTAADRRVAGAADERMRAVLEEDARAAKAFVDRWRPRVDSMTNARHQGMLRVILGETLEQERFFVQALAGQIDLLGRRTDDVGPRVGEVLSTRWIE